MILPEEIIKFIFGKLSIEHKARTFINKKLTKELTESEKDIITNIRNKDYDNALINSAKNGNIKIVKSILDSGANIHARDDYALRLASKNGHLDVVKYLQEYIDKENK